MRTIPAIVFCLSVMAIGCGETQTETEATQAEAPKAAPQSKLNDEGTQKLISLLTDYYSLKDALVKTDGVEAATAAEKLAQSSTDFNMFVVNDSATAGTVQTQLDTISRSSLEISKTDPAEVEQMRAAFEHVSNNMYTLVQQMELKNAGVYQQYCPMAFDDKGAYWLSNETEIRNPYYGKKMLSCGEVTDSL